MRGPRAIGETAWAHNAWITCVLQSASLERKCEAGSKKRAVTRQVDLFVRRHWHLLLASSSFAACARGRSDSNGASKLTTSE